MRMAMKQNECVLRSKMVVKGRLYLQMAVQIHFWVFKKFSIKTVSSAKAVENFSYLKVGNNIS